MDEWRDERAAILQQCMPDCSDGPGTLTYAVCVHALNLWAHCWYSATRDASAPRGARQRCVVLLLPPSGIDGRAAVEAAGPSVLAAADAPSEATDADERVAAERFVAVMQPFRDGVAPQTQELKRAAARLTEVQKTLRAFYAEEAKTPVDEIYSRWSTFLSQARA